jgi:formate dehydrogenase
VKRTIFSHCQYCLCLCGTKISVEDNRVISIEPDRENPHNWRDFCRKGMTAGQAAEHPMRIRSPMRRVGDRYVAASYDEAIDDIATRLNAIIARHGADAIGSYSGQPLDFSFGNATFWSGLLDAIGTGNRFWVGSVDQNNMHVVHEQMFGTEIMSMIPTLMKANASCSSRWTPPKANSYGPSRSRMAGTGCLKRSAKAPT